MGFPKPHAAVIGLGLIGGSLAGALKERSLAASVTGIDANPRHLDIASSRGWIERGFTPEGDGVEEALSACSLVFVAVPVDAMPPLFRWLKPRLQPGALVSDVGSVKAPVLEAAQQWLGPDAAFIGGHPMTGRERSGPLHASAELMQDATYVLCPLDTTPPAELDRMVQLVQAIGGSPLVIPAEEHDRLVALTSHLPYLLALALTHAAREAAVQDDRILRVMAGSFRDATRVAAGDPAMSAAMCAGNRRPLLAALKCFRSELDKLEACLRNADEAGGMLDPAANGELRRLAETARDFRGRIRFSGGPAPSSRADKQAWRGINDD